MSKTIYPNDLCPCGSGKKYKKCCMSKLHIPKEKMSLSYWVDYLKENNLVEEQVAFFEKEKSIANDQLVSIVCNIKQCFAKGTTNFKEVMKSVNTTRIEYQVVAEEHFKMLFVEAASQFVAQMNNLTEDEFVMVHITLDNEMRKQIEW